jgi:hypothetical protein
MRRSSDFELGSHHGNQRIRMFTGSAMAPAWYMLSAGALGQIALMLMAQSAPVRLAHVPQPAAALP